MLATNKRQNLDKTVLYFFNPSLTFLTLRLRDDVDRLQDEGCEHQQWGDGLGHRDFDRILSFTIDASLTMSRTRMDRAVTKKNLRCSQMFSSLEGIKLIQDSDSD